MVQQVDEKALITDLKDGFEKEIKPSEVMRHLFDKYGKVSPVDMAGHYSVAFDIHRMDVLNIIEAWCIDDSSELMDEHFDELILNILPSYKI